MTLSYRNVSYGNFQMETSQTPSGEHWIFYGNYGEIFQYGMFPMETFKLSNGTSQTQLCELSDVGSSYVNYQSFDWKLRRNDRVALSIQNVFYGNFKLSTGNFRIFRIENFHLRLSMERLKQVSIVYDVILCISISLSAFGLNTYSLYVCINISLSAFH